MTTPANAPDVVVWLFSSHANTAEKIRSAAARLFVPKRIQEIQATRTNPRIAWKSYAMNYRSEHVPALHLQVAAYFKSCPQIIKPSSMPRTKCSANQPSVFIRLSPFYWARLPTGWHSAILSTVRAKQHGPGQTRLCHCRSCCFSAKEEFALS